MSRAGRSYQVMTLSAMGEAETPAGGSVCMRYKHTLATSSKCLWYLAACLRYNAINDVFKVAYLEVAHQTAASSGRHDA